MARCTRNVDARDLVILFGQRPGAPFFISGEEVWLQKEGDDVLVAQPIIGGRRARMRAELAPRYFVPKEP